MIQNDFKFKVEQQTHPITRNEVLVLKVDYEAHGELLLQPPKGDLSDEFIADAKVYLGAQLEKRIKYELFDLGDLSALYLDEPQRIMIIKALMEQSYFYKCEYEKHKSEKTGKKWRKHTDLIQTLIMNQKENEDD